MVQRISCNQIRRCIQRELPPQSSAIGTGGSGGTTGGSGGGGGGFTNGSDVIIGDISAETGTIDDLSISSLTVDELSTFLLTGPIRFNNKTNEGIFRIDNLRISGNTIDSTLGPINIKTFTGGPLLLESDGMTLLTRMGSTNIRSNIGSINVFTGVDYIATISNDYSLSVADNMTLYSNNNIDIDAGNGGISIDSTGPIDIGKNVISSAINIGTHNNAPSVTIGDANINKNLVISGNLTVNGNTVTHNVETLTVEDPIIGIRKNATNLGDGGFIIDRKGQNSSNTNRAFVWDESESYFTLIETTSLVDSITLDTSGARSNFRSNKIICDNTLSVHDSTILRSTLSVGNNLLIGTSNLFIDTQNNGDIGIGTSSPSANVHINHTGSLIIPVGTTDDRQSTQGAIRYNNSLSQYEGYNGNNWGSLGGVIDVDQDTYISAENTPGIDNDELKFYTAGTQRMLVGNTGSLSIASNVTISNNLDINNGYQKINNNNSVNQIITNRKLLGTATGSNNSIQSQLFSFNINNLTYNSVSGNSGGLKLQLNISDSVNKTSKFEEYYIQFRYTYDSSDLENIFPLRLLGFESTSSNNTTINDTIISIGTKTGGGGNNRIIPINISMTPTYNGSHPTFYIYYTIIFTGSEGIQILL